MACSFDCGCFCSRRRLNSNAEHTGFVADRGHAVGATAKLGWNTLVVGGLLIVLGALCVALAVRFGIRSLISAIKPADVPRLAEHVYRSRSLDRGLKIVTIGGGYRAGHHAARVEGLFR